MSEAAEVRTSIPVTPTAELPDIDKLAMGKRIKEIRKANGLRQWQLAQILGTTQSAVHKYERGVVPEAKRLIVLAKLGKTSLEWILTGAHPDARTERELPGSGILEIAHRLYGLKSMDIDRLRSTIEILTIANASKPDELAANLIGKLLTAAHEVVRELQTSIAGMSDDMQRLGSAAKKIS